MRERDDISAAGIRYLDHCCRSYFNKYHAKIEKIQKNLEMEDSVTTERISSRLDF